MTYNFLKAKDCLKHFKEGETVTISVSNDYYFVGSILDHQPWYNINKDYSNKLDISRFNNPIIAICIGISRIDGAAMFEYIMTVAEHRELKINEILNEE